MLILICSVFLISTVSASENITINKQDSLQSTIAEAPDESAIILNPGEYKQWGTTISKNITIIGNGAPEKIIINGMDNNYLFKITNGATVKFYNLTLKNGHNNGYGGTIYVENSNAYVINCRFKSNFAFESGGAIASAGSETHYNYLHVENSTFTGNYADHDGGAISTHWGNTVIHNSTFIDNSAYRNGGAVKNGDSSTTKIYNSLFKNNEANNWGGAIYDWPANTKPGHIEIYNCTITNNTCKEYGGGIYFAGPAIIENNTITDNYAGIYGGAIVVNDNHVSTKIPNIEGNVIYDNTAGTKHQDIYILANKVDNLLDYNYWGTDNPLNSSDYKFTWSERINTDKTGGEIQIWLTSEEMNKNKNPITTPSNNDSKPVEKPTIQYNNNNSSRENETVEELKQIKTNINENSHTKTLKNTISKIGFDSVDSQDTDEKSSAKEITKKDTKKQVSTNNAIYIGLIIVVLIVLAYGYHRYRK